MGAVKDCCTCKHENNASHRAALEAVRCPCSVTCAHDLNGVRIIVEFVEVGGGRDWKCTVWEVLLWVRAPVGESFIPGGIKVEENFLDGVVVDLGRVGGELAEGR